MNPNQAEFRSVTIQIVKSNGETQEMIFVPAVPDAATRLVLDCTRDVYDVDFYIKGVFQRVEAIR